MASWMASNSFSWRAMATGTRSPARDQLSRKPLGLHGAGVDGILSVATVGGIRRNSAPASWFSPIG
jgi:hypothetical protein